MKQPHRIAQAPLNGLSPLVPVSSAPATRRRSAGFTFKPCDRVREVRAPGDLDQLQKIALQSTLEAVEALRMDGQIRRLAPSAYRTDRRSGGPSPRRPRATATPPGSAATFSVSRCSLPSFMTSLPAPPRGLITRHMLDPVRL